MAGHFVGTVQTEWLRGTNGDWRDSRMRLTAPFAFIDADGMEWFVPAGALTDGASIPRWLWAIVGGPYEGAYREAAVVHDRYCCTRDEPWWKVHRMFFDACIAAGVPRTKAKILYAGVLLGGPKWAMGQGAIPGECPERAAVRTLDHGAEPTLVQRQLAEWVLRDDPDLTDIERFIQRIGGLAPDPVE